jgi:hypothetical protein
VNLRYGGRRSRRRLDVELFAETLDALEDQYDFVADLERKEIVDKLAAQLVSGVNYFSRSTTTISPDGDNYKLADRSLFLYTDADRSRG